MGTRSSTGVRINGADKLSYNQFDGYPSGIGQAIVKELREAIATLGYDDALGTWRQQAHGLRLMDDSATPTAEDFKAYREAHDSNVSTGQDWYSLLREDQGSVLKRLTRGVATDGNSFIEDSLFCEYAYIVNLDEETLEVYRGYQDQKHSAGRYAGIAVEPNNCGDTWYPCALWATFPLSALPEDLKAALPAKQAEEA